MVPTWKTLWIKNMCYLETIFASSASVISNCGYSSIFTGIWRVFSSGSWLFLAYLREYGSVYQG
jgi:hypothetical protein